MLDVSVIIVNYNTCPMTCECIDSIYRYTEGVVFEIILVDNYSSDGSVAVFESKYPQINIIANNGNVGFGRANNVGAEQAKGKYLFFLNSDTLLIDNVIKSFFDYMEGHPEYSSCGCNLVTKQRRNTVCHGCLPTLEMEFFTIGMHKLFPLYYNNRLSYCQTVDQGNPMDTGYLSGADIFIRAEVFKRLGGFDKNIFMYYEETDLFFRMKKLGLKTCVLPQYSIIHLGGASFGQKSVNRIMMSEQSRYYYYKKNYSTGYAILVKLARIMNYLIRPDGNVLTVIKKIIRLR